MCQLTYVQVPKKTCKNYSEIKRVLTSTLLRLNSRAGHKDGFGIFSDNMVFTVKESADEYPYISRVADFETDNPVIAHVRKASFGFKKKDENGNYFIFFYLIFGHF